MSKYKAHGKALKRDESSRDHGVGFKSLNSPDFSHPRNMGDGAHQQTSLVTPLLVMAHSSISRTTRFQREKVGASPTWATNFDIHFSIYMEMKISQSNQRLIIYFALTLVASFLGDSTVQMIRNEPIIIEHIHWFQWLCIFLGVFLQLLIVWRSFLDQSKNREEHKRSKKK